MSDPGPIVILYDGVCGLCNRFNRFVLDRDRRDRFRFAPLQSPLAARTLARHGLDAKALDTFFAIDDLDGPAERVRARSDGALRVLEGLGGGWRALATAGRVVPRPLRDLAYRAVAASRYRLFGKHDTCPLPSPRDRAKFLDGEPGAPTPAG